MLACRRAEPRQVTENLGNHPFSSGDGFPLCWEAVSPDVSNFKEKPPSPAGME